MRARALSARTPVRSVFLTVDIASASAFSACYDDHDVVEHVLNFDSELRVHLISRASFHFTFTSLPLPPLIEPM